MPATIATWLLGTHGVWPFVGASEPARRVVITQQTSGEIVYHYAADSVPDGTLSDAQIVALRGSALYGAPIKTDTEVAAASAALTAFANRSARLASAVTWLKGNYDTIKAIAPGSRTNAQKDMLAICEVLKALAATADD